MTLRAKKHLERLRLNPDTFPVLDIAYSDGYPFLIWQFVTPFRKSVGLTPMNVPVRLSDDGFSYIAVAELQTDKTYFVVERVDGDWAVYERFVRCSSLLLSFHPFPLLASHSLLFKTSHDTPNPDFCDST